MRVAISVETNQGLDSIVAQHFGRCPYFALIDVENLAVKEVKVIANPFYASHQPGQVPAFIHENRADVMLSGGMGGRAIEFFRQYGIKTATGASGTVRLALERYLGGELTEAAPCQESVAHGHGQ
ncbi:MAG: dinitrogenase iron-molybdenum cofactor biosynthesis protein [Chloroflexi bacterium]|nr:dinitrogenase iron-molybdenum cofactor biosynthesis protein [Chloroflexota bacterium]